MADENDLQLGMSVDITEALQNVKEFGAEFKRNASDMGDALAKASKADFGDSIQSLEVLNMSINDWIDYVSKLEEQFRSLPMGSEEWYKIGDQIRMIKEETNAAKREFEDANQTINTTRVQTGAFRTAVSQSTYALGQFHPALGTAVGALNPMIHGLNFAAVRGQGFKAMLGAVGSQLAGPLGVVAGIGILTTVITTLIKTKKDAVDITKEYAGELQKLRSEVERMSKAPLDLALSSNLQQQSDLISEVMRKGGELDEEEYKRSRLLKEQENILRNQLKTVGDIKNLENERVELEEKIKGLKNIDATQGPLSPGALANLKKYEDRVKEIEGTLSRIRGQRATRTDKAERDIFLTDEQLLKNLKAVDEQLSKTNLSERERNILLAERLKIVKELNSTERERIDQIIQRDIDRAIAESDILFEDISDDALSQRQRSMSIFGDGAVPGNEKLREQIRLGGLLKQTLDDVKDAASDAGKNLITAWISNIRLLDRNISMLQQFINEMFRAIAQAIILRLVTSFITGDGGFLSMIFGGGSEASPASAVSGAPAPGGLNKPSLTPPPGAGYSIINVKVESNPIALQTELRGRDIYFVQKKETDYRKRYM